MSYHSKTLRLLRYLAMASILSVKIVIVGAWVACQTARKQTIGSLRRTWRLSTDRLHRLAAHGLRFWRRWRAECECGSTSFHAEEEYGKEPKLVCEGCGAIYP